MMKGTLKRALAGLAAAALAVMGLAGLAGAASAAPAGQTITITDGGANNGVIDGHSFKYVQIASYTADEDGKYTMLNTVKDPSAVYDAVVAAVNRVFGAGSVPESGVDPLVWAQGVSGNEMGNNSAFPWTNDSRSRQFAQYLVDTLNNQSVWTTAGTASSDSLQINGLDGGLYLIVDTTQNVTDATETLPMLVGTLNDDMQQGAATGTVVVKNQLNAVTKTVTGANNNTVTQGQQVEFTIEGKVPATAGADDDYAYVFTDYANSGIEIKLDNVQVWYGNEPMARLQTGFTVAKGTETTAASPNTTVKGDDVNFDNDPDTADVPTFTVSIPKTTLDGIQTAAGQPLVVKYSATVTTTVTTVDNKATVTSGKNTSTPGQAPTLNTADLSFTKVGEDGTPLDGVQFTIKVADGVHDNTAVIPSGYPTTATSNGEGKVTFPNLADGTYTITEGAPKDGYLDLGLSFDVTITTAYDQDGKKTGVTFEVSHESASKWAGLNYDLVTQDDSGAITVQNITNITQLPLTGAAGTMLFTVLGLLIAGAGVTVYMKSRSVKHALRG